MKRVAVLALIAALCGADAAAAAGMHMRHPRMGGHSHTGGHSRSSHIRIPHPRGASHRRGHRLKISAPQLRGPASGVRPEFVSENAGEGQPSGWFKGEHEAGWGMSHGGTQLVAGLYQRPAQPDIPPPQVYGPEGRGAAGLSLSIKLGQ
jgi:hypothetical protein